ncbi:MAG: DNA polymerase III subunit delta' [Armatimonadia bacterium]|nr:DNA polymerase III subunit delta' [Armatimonadia bacterium]
MAFSDVVGHEQQIQVLRQAIASGRIPNAYLFVGPPNVGKTLVAEQFAMAVNCERLPDDPGAEQVDACGECHNCVRIAQENHPDLQTLRPAVRVEVKPPTEAAQDRDPGEPQARTVARDVYVELPDALIYTEQVERLIQQLSAKPALARRKIAIICSAERMHTDGANKLLKTLEEPPPNTTFVLTCANPSRLLDTIISRCQMVKFHPLSNAELLQTLSNHFPLAEDTLREGAMAMAGGRFGRAKWLMEAPDVLSLRDELLDLIAATPGAPLVQCLRMGERLAAMPERWWEVAEAVEADAGGGSEEERQMRAEALEQLGKRSPDRINRIQMNELLDVLQTWYRDLTLLRADPASPLVLNADRAEQLRSLAQTYSPEGLVWASEVIEDVRTDLLVHNANFGLACQVLMVKLIAAARRQ